MSPIYKKITSAPTTATSTTTSIAAPPPGWTPRPIRRVLTSVPPPTTTPQPIPSYEANTGSLIERTIEWEITDTQERRPIPVVYGRMRFNPKVIYFKATGTTLEAVYLLSEGPIESVEKIWLVGTQVYPTTPSWVTVETALGTLDQSELTIPSDSSWTSIMPGYALLGLKISLLSDDYEGYGLPDVKVELKGRKLFDPRTGTVAWSENPMLVIADLLTHPSYGRRIPWTEIDGTSLGSAADVCDVVVNSEARYRVGTLLDDRSNASSAINDLLLICGGRCGWWDGLWRFSCDWTGSSAATINDDASGGGIPILQSGEVSSLRCLTRRDDAPNACTVTYISSTDWTTREIRYETSAVQSGQEQARELRMSALVLPSASQAYRLAKQWVLQAGRRRYGVTVPQHGLTLAPGDLVTLNSGVGPVSSQVCRLQSIQDRSDGTVDLELLEYNSGDYSGDNYTPDSLGLPDSVVTDEMISYVDDFRFGTLDDGYYGELGWNVTNNTGSNTSEYTTATDHPGILRNSCGSTVASDAGVALNNGQQKFAPNSTWAVKWVWRTDISAMPAASEYAKMYINTTWSIAVKQDNVVYIDDVSTGLSYTDGTWITAEAWCAGGGTMYYTVKWGANEVESSKSVSSTTADQYVGMYHYRGSSAGALPIVTDIDYVHLILGAAQR